MSNKETLQTYNTRLIENNNSLDEVLAMVNALPEAEEGTEEVIDMYSTEETQTNKIWIDGKPIYRKVITSTNALTSGDNAVQHGISTLESVVDVKAFIKFNNTFYPGTVFESSTSFLGFNRISSTDLIIRVGSAWGSSFTQGFIVILEYTKTTD